MIEGSLARNKGKTLEFKATCRPLDRIVRTALPSPTPPAGPSSSASRTRRERSSALLGRGPTDPYRVYALKENRND
jgi:hypothetical protein